MEKNNCKKVYACGGVGIKTSRCSHFERDNICVAKMICVSQNLWGSIWICTNPKAITECEAANEN